MKLIIILIYSVYIVNSFISKKNRINRYPGQNPRIKFENTTKPRMPDNFLKNEAIIFNKIIKNNKEKKEVGEQEKEN